jgi:hypothetical protein
MYPSEALQLLVTASTSVNDAKMQHANSMLACLPPLTEGHSCKEHSKLDHTLQTAA